MHGNIATCGKIIVQNIYSTWKFTINNDRQYWLILVCLYKIDDL